MSARRLAAVALAGAVVVAAGACSHPSSKALGEDPEGPRATITVGEPVGGDGGLPPIGPDGGLGIPTAIPVLSLDIPGVVVVPDLPHCEVRLIATTDTLGFAVRSSEVGTAGIDKLAQMVRSLPEVVHMRFEGHASSEGDPDFNRQLSKDRAKAARAVVEPMLPGVAMDDEGYGADRPIADNSTEAGRIQNRRVEIIAKVSQRDCASLSP